MMEMIISFCPRVIFSTPGIMPQMPPASVPASSASTIPTKPVAPVKYAVRNAAIEPIRNCPSPPRLNTPHL